MDEAWKTMCHLGCEKSHWKLKYGLWMKLFSPFVVPIFMFIGEAWGTGNHPSWIQEILFEAQMWGMGGVILTFYCPNFHVYRRGLNNSNPIILDLRNPVRGPNMGHGRNCSSPFMFRGGAWEVLSQSSWMQESLLEVQIQGMGGACTTEYGVSPLSVFTTFSAHRLVPTPSTPMNLKKIDCTK
jgi:hypothetical protein